MKPSILLIFGTSHVGKSTLARKIGLATDIPVLATDKMGRHPGRPWPKVKAPVAEYYSALSDETIYWFLRVHHENLWPIIRSKISDATKRDSPIIIEGSALRPEFIAPLDLQTVIPVGLCADKDFLQQRIEDESRYSIQDQDTKLQIEKFIRRSIRDNDEILEVSCKLGLRMLDVADVCQLAKTTDDIVGTLSQPRQIRHFEKPD